LYISLLARDTQPHKLGSVRRAVLGETQEDDYGRMRSITAQRYVSDGKKILERSRILGAQACGIKIRGIG
jgi:hypothetical protein